MKVYVVVDLCIGLYEKGGFRGVFDSREKAEKEVMSAIEVEDVRDEIAFDNDRESSEVTDKEVLEWAINPDNDMLLIIETEIK